MINTILHGDALAILKTLPDAFVQSCITSPPYWGLRDYKEEGQIGLETTPEEYTEKLVQVFREVRRGLKGEGLCWLNLGDSYVANGVSGLNVTTKSATFHGGTADVRQRKRIAPQDLKPKNLVGIPWRVAFALQSDGWILRSDVIWHKPNCMPESVQDRPTKSHEYLFLLAKSDRYYYDADAIKELAICVGDTRHLRTDSRRSVLYSTSDSRVKTGNPQAETKNRRTVWSINTQPYLGAHFAVMPTKLVEPCILASSRIGDIIIDPFMGAGTVAYVAMQHERRYLGIELNAEYIELAEKRLDTIRGLWQVSS